MHSRQIFRDCIIFLVALLVSYLKISPLHCMCGVSILCQNRGDLSLTATMSRTVLGMLKIPQFANIYSNWIQETFIGKQEKSIMEGCILHRYYHCDLDNTGMAYPIQYHCIKTYSTSLRKWQQVLAFLTNSIVFFCTISSILFLRLIT